MELSNNLCDQFYIPETSKCPKCNRMLKSEKVLQDHLRYCKRKLYAKCEYCPFVTKYNANLKIHILSMHSKTKSIQEECPKCAKKYKNYRSLQMHLRICGKPHLFQCFDCTKTFRTKTNLNNHITRMHLTISVNGETIGEDLYLKCNECSYKTKHKGDLKKHVIMHCGNEKEVCEKCGRTYKNQVYLRRHSKLCQTKHLKCYRCSFKTHSKKILRGHVHGMHIESTRHACADCGKTYKSKEYVAKHIELRCGKEPHLMCEYCPFRTKYGDSLKRHRTNMHLKNDKFHK